jgi:hypothetical protein
MNKKAIKSFGIINFCIIIVGIILVAILTYHMPMDIQTALTKNMDNISSEEFKWIVFILLSVGIVIFGFFKGTLSFFRGSN